MGVRTWTRADDEYLITGLSSGESYDDIAAHLEKTKGAVKSRVRWLRGIGVCPSPDLDEIPKQIMSDYEIYRLYAGRLYEDYKIESKNHRRVYLRGEVESQTSGQECIEFADSE